MGGLEALDAPYEQVPFWAMVRKRGGWLSALFLGEMLTATAMGHYEAEIARAVVLALFVPLIISIGFTRIVLWQTLHFADYGPHFMKVAATVCFSLIGVVCFGTLAGSMLPFLLRRLGFDPATSSAPFVATLVDVSGLVIYFQVAAVILRHALS
jgi:magnesium transporter